MLIREDRESEYHQLAALLRSTEQGTKLVEALQWWGSKADELIVGVPRSEFSESDGYNRFIRGAWEWSFNEEIRNTVFLEPGEFAELQYLFVTFWKYGEDLCDTFTIFEQAMLESNVFLKLQSLDQEAERVGQAQLASENMLE